MFEEEQKDVSRVVDCFVEAIGRMPQTFQEWSAVATFYELTLAEVDSTIPFRAAYCGQFVFVPVLAIPESFGVIASALTRALLRHPDYARELHVAPILHHRLAALVGQRVVETHSMKNEASDLSFDETPLEASRETTQ